MRDEKKLCLCRSLRCNFEAVLSIETTGNRKGSFKTISSIHCLYNYNEIMLCWSS